MSIVDDLLDLFDAEIIVHPGYLDEFGDWAASGAATNLICRFEGESRLVRDALGNEVTSTVQAIVAGYNNLTTHLHRYTLPSRFIPSGSLRAISIDKHSDEDGPLYEAINFP